MSPSPTDRPRSYFDAESAGDDPLASGLFAVSGVTNVLIHTDFVTVSKEPGTSWSRIKPKIERVLRDAD